MLTDAAIVQQAGEDMVTLEQFREAEREAESAGVSLDA